MSDLIDRSKEWNLGSGLKNVIDSVMRKLRYASHQLEEKERTIINLDTYEVTALIWALSEFGGRNVPDINVVKCKDCRYWKTEHPKANGYHCCHRIHNAFPMREDDFCSKGVRR